MTADEVRVLGSQLHDWGWSATEVTHDATREEVTVPMHEPRVESLPMRVERLHHPASPTHLLRVRHAGAPVFSGDPDSLASCTGLRVKADLLVLHADTASMSVPISKIAATVEQFST